MEALPDLSQLSSSEKDSLIVFLFSELRKLQAEVKELRAELQESRRRIVLTHYVMALRKKVKRKIRHFGKSKHE